jgi:preprotein translocase subunit SecA
MTQALTRYQALYQSVRSRRRRPRELTGVDKFVSTLQMRARTRRITPAFLRDQAQQADRLSPQLREMSESAFSTHIDAVREGFARRAGARGEGEDELLRRGLAAVREAARRETGQEAYVVQLMGAMALYHGRIIEMLTGEGKTLTGSIAAALLAWRHRSLHVFTVNDYLALRDAKSREPIYARCGLTVGAIQQEQQPQDRAETYARSIVYGTPKQITADWLRDQIRLTGITSPWAGRAAFSPDGGGDSANSGNDLASASGLWTGGAMVPGLKAALVDEADAVLIDEGVVPLIIAQSRRGDEMAPIYVAADAIAASLVEGDDYTLDRLRRKAELTDDGYDRCLRLFERQHEPIFRATRRAIELVRTALVARACYKRGQQYAIADGRVVIVDEFTGRFLQDRTWEHGLHQAVEAKEQVDISADRETLARLSFQRFFRSYPFLSGMTGTAADATREMETTYQRPVTVIPTNRPIARTQWPERVFRTASAKLDAIAESVLALHNAGRPVLVGTRSIQASEAISRRLTQFNLPHRVLNANFDKDEAAIIELAGVSAPQPAITVATNMAGRGTDIKPDAGALRAGGLHVILSEMHSAKRIDRQFIGRAGRQGDPGSAQIFMSLQDELLDLFAKKTAAAMRSVPVKHTKGGATKIEPNSDDGSELDRALRGGPTPSENELTAVRRRIALWLFRRCQRRAERRDRLLRADVLRQDTWVEKHLFGQ